MRHQASALAIVVATLAGLGHAGAQERTASSNQLVGKLEGPNIVIDPQPTPSSFVDLMKSYRDRGAGVAIDHSLMPNTFRESPAVAEQVKAGELPPISERLPLPSDVLVI